MPEWEACAEVAALEGYMGDLDDAIRIWRQRLTPILPSEDLERIVAYARARRAAAEDCLSMIEAM